MSKARERGIGTAAVNEDRPPCPVLGSGQRGVVSMRNVFLSAVALVAILVSLGEARGQGLPRPRLLFTPSQLPAIVARANATGTAPASAYGAMVTSVGLSVPSNQADWSFMRNLRRMQEVALRYQITGYGSYGTNARNALMNAVNGLTPTPIDSYQFASYACAVAITYDLVHDTLTASQRAQVISHLEAWVTALRSGYNQNTSYNGYQSACDNYGFAWSAGIVMALLAIEGESNYPNLSTLVQQNLNRLNEGWRDAFSPDGSYDEAYGYTSYGPLYSTWAGIAAQNCGYGDWIAQTNLPKCGAWVAHSFIAGAFPWLGDSSPSHKGLRVDPILWYGVERRRDEEAYWGLNRLFAFNPVADGQATMAFSPWINVLMHHPELPSIQPGAPTTPMQPREPKMWSAFYRDNRNEGSPSSNKIQNYFEVGLGGHAILQSSPDPADEELAALYMIRDEWANHAHEDDGHLMIASEGVWHVVDKAYGGSANAQHDDHNIIVAVGGSAFQSSNHYAPPSPNGRFLGEKKALLLSVGADYVRGDHKHMWMMEQADRTVVMLKGGQEPYILLLDAVTKSGVGAFDALFHASGPAYGAGTLSDPMRIAKSGRTLRTVFLGPASPTVITGGAASVAGMTHYANRVRLSGPSARSASVWGKAMPVATSALTQPASGIEGALLDWGLHQDEFAWSPNGVPVAFAGVSSDLRFLWTRRADSRIVEWIAAEGQDLFINGERWLQATEMVCVSARAGKLEISRTAPSTTLTFALVARAPFPVQAVTLDGVPTPFVQTGEQVFVGGNVGVMGSSPMDDRAYTFRDGATWDAVLGPNSYITPDGWLAASGAFSGFDARGGSYYEVRPVAITSTLRFPAGTGGTIANWKLENQPSSGDVLNMVVTLSGPPAGFARVEFYDFFGQQTPLGTVDVPLGPGGDRVRFTYELDPVSGQVVVLDAEGNALGTVLVPPAPGPFRVRALLRPDTQMDDVLIFDSAEDGNIPQGLCLWQNLNGTMGYAAHAPNLVGFTDFIQVVNGYVMPADLTWAWLILGGFQEIGGSPFYTPGAPTPTTLRNVLVESTFPTSIPAGLPSVGILAQDPSNGRVLNAPVAAPTW